jgi:hypothetical protein
MSPAEAVEGAVRKCALRPCISAVSCAISCWINTVGLQLGYALLVAFIAFAVCLLQAGRACVIGYEESSVSSCVYVVWCGVVFCCYFAAVVG